MSDFIYTPALALLGKGINLQTDDIRVLIVMANSTAGAEPDSEFIADFSVLDEFNGTSYTRQVLTTKSMSPDLINDRGKFTSDSITFTTIGVGSRAGIALVFFKRVTNDSDSPVIAYKIPAGWPVTANGNDVVVNPHVNGWFYNKNG